MRRFLVAYVYRLMLAPWMHQFTVEGIDRIPPGPVIYAAMHTSMADTPLILRALGRRGERIVVTAARDYFFRRARPGFGPFVALAFGAVPIDRTGPARQSLSDAITWLRRGFSVIIYPEGTIPGRADNEKQLHAGVALLAKRAHCPVIPVRIVGAADVLPAGVHWPRHATVHVTFLPPLSFTDAENSERFIARLSSALFKS